MFGFICFPFRSELVWVTTSPAPRTRHPPTERIEDEVGCTRFVFYFFK